MNYLRKSFSHAFMLLFVVLIFVFSTSIAAYAKPRVLIYTSSSEDMKNYMQERLTEQFPEYDIILEYISTGAHAAKIKAEGANSEADISFDLETSYLVQIKDSFATLDSYDYSIYNDNLIPKDKTYLISIANACSIIINADVLKAKNLPMPTSYQDLLKPEYKNLISIPGAKSSSTGFLLFNLLIQLWGEEEALDYFDELSENVLQFTSSGSGPVNALVQGEVAIGFGMTSHAVLEMNKGVNLKIIQFEEGSPVTAYGYGIIKGKENKKEVQDVMNFLYSTLMYETNERFYPEPIFKGRAASLENYPTDTVYSKEYHPSPDERAELLDLWEY